MKRFNSSNDVKVLFFGTPEIASTVLKALIEDSFNVVGVVSQEDKEVGRKRILTKAPTKAVAESHNIPVFSPHKIRLDYEFAKSLDFDVIVTISYGQIIPSELLAMAKVGSVNLHGSLLPKYRGASPIQSAIKNGDKVTGITLMEMVAKMDAGCIYDKEEVTIEDNDNYSSLCLKMGEAAASLIKKDLLAYANGELKGEEQDENLVSFTSKIKPEDEHLSLTLGYKESIDYIRSLSNEPGAYLYLNEKKLKIYRASLFSAEIVKEPGSLIANKKHLLLQLKDGIISLDEVQMEGKKQMDGASFLQGAHLSGETKFA